VRNFPSHADLSREQQKIYSEHLEKALLITGPPGTGKTVMAIMRGQRIAEHEKYSTNLLMFNNALKDFTKSNTKTVDVSTLDSYLTKKFKISHAEKMVTGKYEFPWSKVKVNVNRYLKVDELEKVFPSQVLIDEGQDFPPILWEILSSIWLKLHSADILFAPTVMADENQRLHVEANSNIDDIRQGLGLVPSCLDAFVEEKLTRNYRNTFEIAEFAKHFYVGNQTEIPNSDYCRAGTKPTLFFHNNKKSDLLINRILNFKINNPTKTVGVIIPKKASTSLTESVGLNLKGEVQKRRLDNIKVQYRVSRPRREYASFNDLELDFDSTNTITVLTQQSSKGLEFDCVFVPFLNQVDYSDDGFDQSMTLYVIFHRARDFLFLGSNINKGAQLKIPDILCKPLKVKDYKGDPLTVGFNNIAELENKITIENDIVENKVISKSISSQDVVTQSKPALKDKQGFEKDNLIPHRATEKDQREYINKKKQEKLYKEKEDLVIESAETKTAQKEILEKLEREKQEASLLNKKDSKQEKISKLKKDKKASHRKEELKRKIEEFIGKNSNTPTKKENIDLLNNMLKKDGLLTYGEQNIYRAKWQKSHNVNNKNKNSAKNNKKSSLIELNMVGGTQSEYRKILQIVKGQIENMEGSMTQIVTLKKDPKKVFKLFSRYCVNNLGILTMVKHSDLKILFKTSNIQREISVLGINSKINWNEKIIILGLGDLNDEDLKVENIQDFLVQASLKSKITLNIIHPNTAEETPGVKYLNEKNDDGSVKITYEQF
jgi:DNA helicase-2/ATP-dependent DNA helicase PcrA